MRREAGPGGIGAVSISVSPVYMQLVELVSAIARSLAIFNIESFAQS